MLHAQTANTEPQQNQTPRKLDAIKAQRHNKYSNSGSIRVEFEIQFVCNGGSEHADLTPRCVNFIPVHRLTGQAAQAKVVDSAKVAIVPDMKGVVAYVGSSKLLQTTLSMRNGTQETVSPF